MTSINLYQAQTPKNEGVSKARYIDSGFIVSIGVLVLVLVSLGGAKIYLAELVKQNTQLENKIKEEQVSGLSGDMVDRAADFQQRLDMIKASSEGASINNLLTDLSNFIVQGVVVDSFKYDKGAMEMTLKADNYVSLARQILSFKQQDEKYSNVTVINVRREEDKILFDTSLALVNKKQEQKKENK